MHTKTQKILSTCQSQNITLIAASKTRSVAEIIQAQKTGIKHFGENYVQEALEKLDAYKDAHVHLIGHLQTKKAKDAVKHFESVHSLDRIKLANALQKECEKQERASLTVFIQVNQGSEESKGGVLLEDLDRLVQHVRKNCPNLVLEGLMTIPPKSDNPESYFKQLKELSIAYNIPKLSMGMSGDWQLAIKNGATHIRVGSAIFGPR